MTFPGLTDPAAAVRAMIARGEQALFDRVVDAMATTTVDTARNKLRQQVEDLHRLLNAVPHRAAGAAADLARGRQARPLSAGEMALVTEAYTGRLYSPDIRIVDGPGRSVAAMLAFGHGNPAITIGNTIFVRHETYVSYGGANLAQTEQGIGLIVHECMHVRQYATLGFRVFGIRYYSELRAHHNDPDELYDYEHRDLDFAHETLEGQADILGNYAEMRHSANPARRARADFAKKKLRGTGYYGL